MHLTFLHEKISQYISQYFLLSSHPNDEKEGLFHRNHSVIGLASFRQNHNHVHDTSLPLVSQDHEEMHDSKSAEHDKEVFVTLFVSRLLACVHVVERTRASR